MPLVRSTQAISAKAATSDFLAVFGLPVLIGAVLIAFALRGVALAIGDEPPRWPLPLVAVGALAAMVADGAGPMDLLLDYADA
jgi:hypothetical protein